MKSPIRDAHAAVEKPSSMPGVVTTEAVFLFENQAAWVDWLAAHHQTARAVWLRIAKAQAPVSSASYAEAIDTVLCFGWIDGRKQAESAHDWLQRMTPRSARSMWSKVNRDKAMRLIAEGHMQPAGLREIERPKEDGRWEAAYAGARAATVPEDLRAALDANPRAKAFFARLDGSNRYAILFRVQTAKKAETRAAHRDLRRDAGQAGENPSLNFIHASTHPAAFLIRTP